MHCEPDPLPGDFDSELDDLDFAEVQTARASTKRSLILLEADGVTQLRRSAPAETKAPEDPRDGSAAT